VSADTLTRPDVSVEGSRAELDRIARELDDRSKSLWIRSLGKEADAQRSILSALKVEMEATS
jgi:hypothetical protein